MLSSGEIIKWKLRKAQSGGREDGVPGEPVSGAGDDVEELRQGVDEVDHLGDEEEQHGFAEVPQDAHHRKGHPRKVAEGVAHEHRGGVPARRTEDNPLSLVDGQSALSKHILSISLKWRAETSAIGEELKSVDQVGVDIFFFFGGETVCVGRWNKPVMVEKSQRGEEERKHEVQRENVVVSIVSCCVKRNRHQNETRLFKIHIYFWLCVLL